MRAFRSPRRTLVATVAAVFNWAAGKGGLMKANPIKADGGFDRPRVPRGAEQYAERTEAAAHIAIAVGSRAGGQGSERANRARAS